MIKFHGFFEDHRSEYCISDIAVFFLVLCCLTSVNGVNLDNMDTRAFTAKPFSQFILEEKLKIINDGKPILNNI